MTQRRSIVLGCICLVLSLVAASGIAARAGTGDTFGPDHRDYPTVEVSSVQDLEQLYQSLDYQWPPYPGEAVPPVVLEKIPDDVVSVTDVAQRKSLFLRTLLPIVLMENQRIQETRRLLTALMASQLPAANSPAGRWLSKLAKEYRVKGDLSDPELQQRLLMRIDEVPVRLVLAQAVIESGWGTSRFARQGNSLFGQWTYTPTSGMTPEARADDATHFVHAFPDLRASVRAYLQNLNTGRAYREFRLNRARLRDEGNKLTAYELAGNLHRYSARGEDYVKELRQILNSETFSFMPDVNLLDANHIVTALETHSAI